MCEVRYIRLIIYRRSPIRQDGGRHDRQGYATMNNCVCRIRHSDSAYHDRFFSFVASIFKVGRTFFDWGARGGWVDGYEVFAMIVDGQIVSTVGRQSMQCVINGEARNGYQIGAVATHSDHRNRGLARALMERVLDELDAPDQPVIVFANASVLDFYPRFGFRRLAQSRFVGHIDVRPANTLAPSLDLSKATDRTWLADHCVRANAIGRGFTARDYYPTLLFHLTREPLRTFRLDSLEAVVVAQQDGERLLIRDLLAVRAFSLMDALPRLCTQPARTIEFGFHPEVWWPNAESEALHDAESRLFVRGTAAEVGEPVRFPDLAHT
jgi:GNAT superfamily N-acetyltransferase